MKNSGNATPYKYDFSLFVAPQKYLLKSKSLPLVEVNQIEHKIDFSQLFVKTDTSVHNCDFPQKKKKKKIQAWYVNPGETSNLYYQ